MFGSDNQYKICIFTIRQLVELNCYISILMSFVLLSRELNFDFHWCDCCEFDSISLKVICFFVVALGLLVC